MCAPNLRSCSAMSLMRAFPTTGSTIAMVLFDASDTSVQWLQQFLSASDRSVAYQTQFVFLVETKIDTIISDEMKGKSEEARRKLGNVQWMLNRSAFKSVVRRCAFTHAPLRVHQTDAFSRYTTAASAPLPARGSLSYCTHSLPCAVVPLASLLQRRAIRLTSRREQAELHGSVIELPAPSAYCAQPECCIVAVVLCIVIVSAPPVQ